MPITPPQRGGSSGGGNQFFGSLISSALSARSQEAAQRRQIAAAKAAELSRRQFADEQRLQNQSDVRQQFAQEQAFNLNQNIATGQFQTADTNDPFLRDLGLPSISVQTGLPGTTAGEFGQTPQSVSILDPVAVRAARNDPSRVFATPVQIDESGNPILTATQSALLASQPQLAPGVLPASDAEITTALSQLRSAGMDADADRLEAQWADLRPRQQVMFEIAERADASNVAENLRIQRVNAATNAAQLELGERNFGARWEQVRWNDRIDPATGLRLELQVPGPIASFLSEVETVVEGPRRLTVTEAVAQLRGATQAERERVTELYNETTPSRVAFGSISEGRAAALQAQQDYSDEVSWVDATTGLRQEWDKTGGNAIRKESMEKLQEASRESPELKERIVSLLSAINPETGEPYVQNVSMEADLTVGQIEGLFETIPQRNQFLNAWGFIWGVLDDTPTVGAGLEFLDRQTMLYQQSGLPQFRVNPGFFEALELLGDATGQIGLYGGGDPEVGRQRLQEMGVNAASIATGERVSEETGSAETQAEAIRQAATDIPVPEEGSEESNAVIATIAEETGETPEAISAQVYPANFDTDFEGSDQTAHSLYVNTLFLAENPDARSAWNRGVHRIAKEMRGGNVSRELIIQFLQEQDAALNAAALQPGLGSGVQANIQAAQVGVRESLDDISTVSGWRRWKGQFSLAYRTASRGIKKKNANMPAMREAELQHVERLTRTLSAGLR